MADRDPSEFVLSFFAAQGAEAAEFWASAEGQAVLGTLLNVSNDPLSLSHLDSLLWRARMDPVSEGFYRYYFLSLPTSHPYPVDHVMEDVPSLHTSHIVTVAQLEWGIRRFLTDALLYFPNTQSAFDSLRRRSYEDLVAFFAAKRIDDEGMQLRGPALPLADIPTDDRYLISELACRAYSQDASPDPFVLTELMRAYNNTKGGRIPVKQLVDTAVRTNEDDFQLQLALPLGADEFIEQEIESEDQLRTLVSDILTRFHGARKLALDNTEQYLSILRELDVYVATSMRCREDFRDMARNCQTIFADERLRPYHLRYFDPTLSAALGHEDKGVLECVMVDRAKVLIYFAQEGESWGKDAEATRALTQGKPVIIYCPPTPEGRQRMLFFRDIHPLSRLLDMRTGVAAGAVITDGLDNVRELLYRMITNRMQYDIDRRPDGSLRLRDRLTQSAVRFSSSDQGLNRAVREYYCSD